MKNKIGIVLPFQNGDLITGTAVLHYRDILWPDCDIVWFCNEPHSDALKFQDIETRYFPHGWGILANDIAGIYSERVKKDKDEGRPEWEDWSILMNSENRLKQELKNKFSSFSDLSDAYFAAPWMLSVPQRHGISYPDCSKKIFNIPMDWDWHPTLSFSNEEANNAFDFIEKLPEGHRLFIETFAGSDQSKLSHEMVVDTMKLCRDKWPGCVFLFASHKYLRAQENFPEKFFDAPDVFSCAKFTVRQCALIADECNLIISVSSGLTVAASRWGANPIPICQYTGSWVCSTASLAKGRHFELVTADNKLPQVSQTEFYLRLESLLNQYK